PPRTPWAPGEPIRTSATCSNDFASTAVLDPLGARFADLFFPDGGAALQAVDGRAAGVEGGAAVGRRGRDDDRGLADLQRTDPVVNGHVRAGNLALDLGHDVAEHALGHLAVRL